MFHGGSRRLELELSFTHSPVSEVTVRRFGAKVSDGGRTLTKSAVLRESVLLAVYHHPKY